MWPSVRVIVGYHKGMRLQMDLLGEVEQVTYDGRLIIQCNGSPDIGDTVYDNKNERIGTVNKIFGPIKSPYVSVIPEKTISISGLGDIRTLFVRGGNNGKNKRRNRRNRSMP